MPYLFYYLLKVTICSAVLFGYYYFFLRNKVYHAYNRFYLLAIVIISLMSPMINLDIFVTDAESAQRPVQLLQVVTNSNAYLEELVLQPEAGTWNVPRIFSMGYLLVSLILLFILSSVLFTIVNILRKSKARKLQDITFIQSDAKGTPFSFFNFIFWNSAIDINTTTGQRIFAHELAHVREKHSADKLFLNLALIACWINPIFWLLRKELNLIHEFIADKRAVVDNDAQSLAAMIVTSAYPRHSSYLITNHFFYSPIKRRLQMLSKYSNKKAGYFYRVLALPVVLLMVAAISIKAKSKLERLYDPAEKLTVVIDAGHGGHDAGAVSQEGKQEKDLTLAFVKAIKSFNQSANIEVILTRESDIYQTPQEKAAFTREAGADLFISVHVATTQFPTDVTGGMEVFVAKDQHPNSAASKLFASAVIANFQANYGIAVAPNPQQREMGIFVLQANNIPSILIESGYLSNKKDLAYLSSNDAKEVFAKNILAAIAAYANESRHQPTAAMSNGNDTVPVYIKPPTHYKGKKIRSVQVTSTDQHVKLTLVDGSAVRMTMDEAESLNLLPPPPPPAPPVAAEPPAPPAPPVMANDPLPAPPPVPAVPAVPPAPPKPPVKNKNKNKHSDVEVRLTEPVIQPVVVDTKLSVNLTTPEAQPLIVIDYVEVPYVEMKKIDPNNIERINVLKGAEAAKKYGDKKAANGVIEIITKRSVITKVAVKEKLNETVAGEQP